MKAILPLVPLILAAIGCSSSTRINFQGPPNSVLYVDNKPYHLPVELELSRPSTVGESKRHDVSLVSTVKNQELRAKGYIDLVGYNESDVDKISANTCYLDEEQLARMFQNTVVVFRGQSASRQHLYDLTLTKQ